MTNSHNRTMGAKNSERNAGSPQQPQAPTHSQQPHSNQKTSVWYSRKNTNNAATSAAPPRSHQKSPNSNSNSSAAIGQRNKTSSSSSSTSSTSSSSTSSSSSVSPANNRNGSHSKQQPGKAHSKTHSPQRFSQLQHNSTTATAMMMTTPPQQQQQRRTSPPIAISGAGAGVTNYGSGYKHHSQPQLSSNPHNNALLRSGSPGSTGGRGSTGSSQHGCSPPNISLFAASKWHEAPAPQSVPKPPLHWHHRAGESSCAQAAAAADDMFTENLKMVLNVGA